MNEILKSICENLEKRSKKAWVRAYEEWAQYIESAQAEIVKIIRVEMGEEYVDRLETGYQIARAKARA